ncbi:MAG: NusG domain II-containing protein [Ruminococcaceae bacterium]|nr:NusG domain II-containing protein [Oscillospiraceae bacterium]
MRARDWIVIGAIALLALVLFAVSALGFGGEGGVVRVYRDGTLYTELSLDRDEIITVMGEGGAFNQVEVKNGAVRMKDANCPDKTCVACGWRNPADRQLLPDERWIVCLPNRVSVELPGE